MQTMTGNAVVWTDPRRRQTFDAWLARIAGVHGLRPDTLRPASADASFRRYLRIDGDSASFIVMDAPPALEDCRPFVQVAALMADAGIAAPSVLAWNEAAGFMLLTDLGAQTLMELIAPPADVHAIAQPTALHHTLYLQAVDALIAWQLSSKPGVLPPYDDALLSRELQLFPDWYVKQHRGLALDGRLQDKLDALFTQIKSHNLNALGGARVFVHRDFMARNLMVMPGGGQLGKASAHGGSSTEQGPRDWLRQTAGAAAPSGGRELHAVSDRGGKIHPCPDRPNCFTPPAKPRPPALPPPCCCCATRRPASRC